MKRRHTENGSHLLLRGLSINERHKKLLKKDRPVNFKATGAQFDRSRERGRFVGPYNLLFRVCLVGNQ